MANSEERRPEDGRAEGQRRDSGPREPPQEQHRVLTINGRNFCNSECVFCVQKFSYKHPAAPNVDTTRKLIVEGSGRYNMLFFMDGEPTLHAKLFEYVDLAKSHGFQLFGMSSHFRTFSDPKFALKVLEAGFTFFDISLHAADTASQLEVNPLDDGGRSLPEALHGLRNIQVLAKRIGRKVAVTHKIVISRLNYKDLLRIFRSTYKYGVRNYVLQPVKVSGLEPALAERLAINEDEFMPYVNELLRATESSGAYIKLYGMSQAGAYNAKHLTQETNVIRHSSGKGDRAFRSLTIGDRLISLTTPATRSDAPVRRVRLQVPDSDEAAEFECREDEIILNAALRSGLLLPYGCRMGSCGMCCGRVVEGKVAMNEQSVLDESRVTDGYALLCQSKPTSDVVILTHQEEELGL